MTKERGATPLRQCGLLILLSLFSGEGAMALTVERSEDKEVMRIEWEPPAVQLKAVVRADGNFTEVGMEGVPSIAKLGGPSLPRLSRYLAVPPGKKIVLENVVVETDLQSCDSPVAYAQNRKTHCRPRRPKVYQDPALYELPDAEAVELGPVTMAGSLPLVRLDLNPVRRASDDELLVTRRLSFDVRYVPLEGDEDGFRAAFLSANEVRFFKSLVLNPEQVPGADRGDRRVDLILSPAKYVKAIEPLIKFKEAHGREVRLRLVDKHANTTKVKAIIAKEYQSALPPSHTLLVGSLDDVVSFKRDDYWTDYPYSLLDAGNLPDLSIGRLPVQSDTELHALVEKLIARESTPRNDAAILVTSGNEVNWCHVNLKYIMEQIFAKAQLPLEITKLYSSEGADTAKIIAAYNQNPNLIVYDGHGNANGMTELPFLMEHLPKLKNTVHPLIFDIACLNAYWPSTGSATRNFADSISTLKNSGAAGIMASSSYSGGHDLFKAIFRASVFDELTPANPYHQLHEVGEAIRYGKIKYLEGGADDAQVLTDNELFYYLGDPASTIFFSQIIPVPETMLDLPLDPNEASELSGGQPNDGE